MADTKGQTGTVAVAEADGFPKAGGRGRKRNFRPESGEAAKAVLAGKVLTVSGENASKVVSQVRTLVEEAGQKLKTRQVDGTTYLGLAPAKA